MRRCGLALLACLALGGAAACGGGPTGTLTVSEALAGGGGEVTVRGSLLAPAGEPVRLCSALLESYPPQCGEPSLVVRGLDLQGLGGLASTEDPALAQVTWSNGQLDLSGTLDGDVLTVQP